MTTLRSTLLLPIAAAFSFLLSSCGRDTSSNKQTPGGGGAPHPAIMPESKPPAAAVPDKAMAKSSATQVHIDNFTFTPQTLTVERGTKVTWTNRDDVPHTVKSTEKKFLSKTLDTDDTFSFTFTEPGTYDYFCTVHSHMTGKIVVK